MLKIENTDVYGWEAAIRGARNPMNSWDKSDTMFNEIPSYPILGNNDFRLLRNLANAGPDHGKYLRMITVSLDITAPLYWYKEFDTYKVGTVANSCSTMHKIHAKEFTLDDFSHEHLIQNSKVMLEAIIHHLNEARSDFLYARDHHLPANYLKQAWWQMIQLLPTSYNQRRTVLLNYAVLRTMYHARKHHKLDEWRQFCDFIRTLPYSELITGGEADL